MKRGLLKFTFWKPYCITSAASQKVVCANKELLPRTGANHASAK